MPSSTETKGLFVLGLASINENVDAEQHEDGEPRISAADSELIRNLAAIPDYQELVRRIIMTPNFIDRVERTVVNAETRAAILRRETEISSIFKLSLNKPFEDINRSIKDYPDHIKQWYTDACSQVVRALSLFGTLESIELHEFFQNQTTLYSVQNFDTRNSKIDLGFNQGNLTEVLCILVKLGLIMKTGEHEYSLKS